MRRYKIGIVAPLTGQRRLIGEGIVLSLRFVIEGYASSLSKTGVEIDIIEYDDKSDVVTSLALVAQAKRDGCVAVVGPADSACAYIVARSDELHDLPIILSFATIDDEAVSARGNIFRVTSPNSRRTDTLIRHVRQQCPENTIRLFFLEGGEHTYSVSNHRQLVQAAVRHGVQYREIPFSIQDFPVIELDDRSPVIVSAPSFEGSLLLKHLRESGVRAPAFGFGSNTNWLNADAVGLVVVCDLDRNDRNPEIRERLRQFEKAFKTTNDPSIPTMLAGLIVVQAIEDIDENRAATVDVMRENFMNQLWHGVFKGIVGNLKFDERGEMIGHEQISILEVVGKRGRYSFKGIEQAPSAIVSETAWYSRQAKEVLMIVAAVAGIAGFAIAIAALL